MNFYFKFELKILKKTHLFKFSHYYLFFEFRIQKLKKTQTKCHQKEIKLEREKQQIQC